MIDIILIVIAVLSLAYILWLVVRKFPRLKNVNVDDLPEIKAQRQKDEILKGRLGRFWQDIFDRVDDYATPAKEKVNGFFGQYYDKLKNAEQELRRKGHQRLTTAVDKLQTANDLLTEAKQYINQEEYQKAEDALVDVLSFDEHNVDAYKLLAEVYRLKKEYVQAKETLEYLLKLTHDEDASVYYSLADIAKERGNLKQAEEDYIKSISLSSDNDQYFLSLAEVYLDLEENEKAFEVAQNALVLSPRNPKVLDFLINTSIIMQDKELATQYLDKLKEVNPENNKITDFLEQIDNID